MKNEKLNTDSRLSRHLAVFNFVFNFVVNFVVDSRDDSFEESFKRREGEKADVRDAFPSDGDDGINNSFVAVIV